MSPVPDDVYIQEMHQLVVQELDQAQDLVSRIKASFQGRNEKRGACVVCTERSSITSLCTARMKRAQTKRYARLPPCSRPSTGTFSTSSAISLRSDRLLWW